VRTAKADYHAKAEQYEEALELYNAVLKEQKGNYYIWEQTIFIENMLERPEDVFRRCNEAIKYFDDKPLLYLFKGNAASQLGKHEEALKSLEKGLQYTEGNIPLKVQFYSFLAEAWRNEENNERSDEYFEKALEMEPDNIMILNNYSYYLSLRGEKLKDAEKMSRRTIETDPDNPTYLDTYAWVLFKSGKTQKALEYLEKALDNGGSTDPDILEHYADVLAELGLLEKARTFWEKAIENGGNAQVLKQKINE
jgi:tetratricopeptide (TPR) repeat protein